MKQQSQEAKKLLRFFPLGKPLICLQRNNHKRSHSKRFILPLILAMQPFKFQLRNLLHIFPVHVSLNQNHFRRQQSRQKKLHFKYPTVQNRSNTALQNHSFKNRAIRPSKININKYLIVHVGLVSTKCLESPIQRKCLF